MKLHCLSGVLLSLLANSLFAQLINVTTTGVGIGTTTPAPFSANDTRRVLHVRDTSYGSLLRIQGVNTDIELGEAVDLNSAFLYTRNAHPFRFGTANVERVRINEVGNVGIGNDQPEAQLQFGPHLSGQAMSPVFRTNASALSTSAGSELIVSSLGYTTGNRCALGVRARRMQAGADWTTTAIGLGMDVDHTPRVNGSLWIYANGTFGINTTSTPGHALAVNGQVKSKGFITDTSNWSDYVFAPDYHLASLEEVEAHIKEKKHLPGVPSEAELVEKGLDLGAMSAAQMAQIEQLMLHVIEMNKKLKAQATRIEELEAVIGKSK